MQHELRHKRDAVARIASSNAIFGVDSWRAERSGGGEHARPGRRGHSRSYAPRAASTVHRSSTAVAIRNTGRTIEATIEILQHGASEWAENPERGSLQATRGRHCHRPAPPAGNR